LKPNLIVLLSLLLTGCGTVAPIPEDVFLRLQLTTAPVLAETPWGAEEVRVTPLVASGVHKERALVYTSDHGSSLHQANHLLWIDHPEHMLQHEIARYLRAAKIAPQVLTEHSTHTRLVVSGRLLRFEQVTQDGLPSMSVEIELMVRDAPRDRRLFEKAYAVTETQDERTATAAALAMSRAVATLCAAFVADVSAARIDRQLGEELAP
jgi:ABC-type uncharacterized transport system auxiliary subunit